jgi:hypothetical protein
MRVGPFADRPLVLLCNRNIQARMISLGCPSEEGKPKQAYLTNETFYKEALK